MNIDYARMFSYYLPGIEEASSNNLPKITSLSTSNPNPITNGLAKISFTISEPTKASLKIYDASGRMVKTLVNSKLDKGVYNLTWNGTDDDNNAVAEGIYFYTLKTDNYNSTKKLVMMR
jgi:flagellar hook assembly protein FlgD